MTKIDLKNKSAALQDDLSFLDQSTFTQIKSLHQIHVIFHLGYLFYPLLMGFGFSLCYRAIFGPSYGLKWNLAVYLVGLVTATLGMNSCFLLIHEATHRVLFRWKWLNDGAGVFLALLGGISFTAYQALHLAHHDGLGGPNDPDEYANYTTNKRLLWRMHWGRLLFGTLLYVVVFPWVSMKVSTRREKFFIVIEYCFLIVCMGILYDQGGLGEAFLVWLPCMVMTNFLINIRGFTQHGFSNPMDPFLASRSVLAPRLIRFFLINENFHLEHHLFPGVPGYSLAKLHRLLSTELPYRLVIPSYAQFIFQFIRQSRTYDESIIGTILTAESPSLYQNQAGPYPNAAK